ncbi:MAG: S8/S53 family peptidase [Planctomycetes bacterium]|nr:S8/S53 family peptidase [Planctomycetota bacterium]
MLRLRDRTFEPRSILALARAQGDPQLRRQILATLAQSAAENQIDIRLAAENLGGRLVQSFWSANACLVEIPERALPQVAQLARVARVWPCELRGPAGEVPRATRAPVPAAAPLYDSGSSTNHAFSAAWTLATHNGMPTHKGSGATIGFFDSGLDLDDGTGNPHPAFQVAAGTGTRLLGSFLVPGSMWVTCNGAPVQWPAIDCNLVHPFGPGKHLDMRHGTGMACVAAGRRVPQATILDTDGHAPDAWVVGWSITRGDPQNPPCPETSRWAIDDAAYLTAVEMVHIWLVDTGSRLDVLNISFDGYSDPDHPVSLALDDLASLHNVLLVAAVGNQGDSTRFTHAFHNGLLVGAAPKRSAGDLATTVYSARGPLFGNPKRFAPDVCAIGGEASGPPVYTGVVTGMVDPGVVAQGWYETAGTSLATPQVSGAAALYIARRMAVTPGPAAAETRAAILANVIEVYASNQFPSTYENRNAYGVGFVRDDHLAMYAERFGSQEPFYRQWLGHPLGRSQETVLLTPTNPVVDVTWSNLAAAQPHVVACAWDRRFFDVDAPPPLQNIDLEVWTTDGIQRLAQSASLANSYERLVFRTPQGTTAVKIRVIGRDLFGQNAPVHLAARLHPEPSTSIRGVGGMVEVIPQPVPVPPCAPAVHPDAAVQRVVPVTYSDAWGSSAFKRNSAAQPPQGFDFPGPTTQVPKSLVHAVYSQQSIGAAASITGISFRVHRPWTAPNISNTAGPITINLLGLSHMMNNVPPGNTLQSPVDPAASSFAAVYPQGVVVAQNVNLAPFVPAAANAPTTSFPGVSPLDRAGWTFRIPLNQSFPYNPGDPNGGNLALWWDASWPPAFIGRPITVDGLSDGPNAGYASRHGGFPAQDGKVPLLGLGLGGVSSTPRLDAIGEPYVGDWLWFVLHGFGGSDRTLELAIGSSNPSIPFPGLPCYKLFTNLELQVPVPWSAAMQRGDYGLLIPTSPDMLFRDIFLQGLDRDPATQQLPSQLSNGLRLRIGGKVQ